MRKQYYVYIIASEKNGTLYIGVTGDLKSRIWEHRQAEWKGFASKYNISNLVYYECFDFIENAIKREKQLKKWNRGWKLKLIEDFNPVWKDLWDSDVEFW